MNSKVNENNEIAVKKVASLTGMAKAKLGNVSRRDIPLVPINMLVVEPGFNIRGVGFDQSEYWIQEHIQEYVENLAHSYLEGAYVPPIVVKFDMDNQKAIIRDGHHRYKGLLRAVELGASIERVEVIENRGDEATQNLLMLQSANSLELSAVEKAEAIYRLFKYGLEPQEIASKIKKSITFVNDMLRVYDLPMATKKLIQQKKLSYANALAGDREAKPKKAKAPTPSKKAVLEFIDIITEFRNAQVGLDGKVNIRIPADLLEKLLANFPEVEPVGDDNQETLQFPE